MKDPVFLIRISSPEEFDLVWKKGCQEPNDWVVKWDKLKAKQRDAFLNGTCVIRVALQPVHGSYVAQDTVEFYETDSAWKKIKKTYLTAEEFLNDEWNDVWTDWRTLK